MFRREKIEIIENMFKEENPSVYRVYNQLEFIEHGSLFLCRYDKPQLVLGFYQPNTKTVLLSEAYLEIWNIKAVEFMVRVMSSVITDTSTRENQKVEPFEYLDELFISDDRELYLPALFHTESRKLVTTDHLNWVRRIRSPKVELALSGRDLRSARATMEEFMVRKMKTLADNIDFDFPTPDQLLRTTNLAMATCPYCVGIPKLSYHWDEVFEGLPDARCGCCNARLDQLALASMEQLVNTIKETERAKLMREVQMVVTKRQ